MGVVALFLMPAAASLASLQEIEVLNPGFEAGANPAADDWTRVDGTAPNSSPSNYAEQIPGLTSRTMQLKSDGGNYVEQALSEDKEGGIIDASSFPAWTVSFQQGYRRDAVTNGDHTIRVSLWNTVTDEELGGTDFLIPNPGVGTNSLSEASVVISYDNTDPGLVGQEVALRFTSVSPNLGGGAWQRTAVIDDVRVFGGQNDPDIQIADAFSLRNNGAPQTFDLVFSNGGVSQNLVVSSVVVDGADEEFFDLEGFTSDPVPPGEDGVIQLGFDGIGAGPPYEITLTVESNDALKAILEIPVSVVVVDPGMDVSPVELDFGTLGADPGPMDLSVTVTNTGAEEDLGLISVSLLGGPEFYEIISAPDDPISPGESEEIVVRFDPGPQTGLFTASLEITSDAEEDAVVIIPIVAAVESTPGNIDLVVVNGDFNLEGWGNTESPTGWTSGGFSYGQGGVPAPGAVGTTPNLTSIAAHLQANEAFYQQDLAVGNPGLTADIPERVFVQFLAGYRNDAVTNGDITLRVSLWNLSTDAEIIGRDLVLKDPGVDSGSNANQLLAYQFGFVYDASAHSGDGLGIRIAHVSPSLASAFTATAMIDDVEVSIDGEFEPVDVDPVIQIADAFSLRNNGAPQTFDLVFSNGGISQNLVVSSVVIDGADEEFFDLEGFTSDPVPPGEDGVIQLGFSGIGPGPPYEITLTVESNDALEPILEIPVSVLVVDPGMDVSPAELDFGMLGANPGPMDLSVTVTNTGAEEDLLLTSVSLLGGLEFYEIISAPDNPISPGESGEIVVRFDPGPQTGLFTASLEITSDAEEDAVVIIPIVAAVESTPGSIELVVVNGDFNQEGWGNTESPTGWTSGGFSYGQGAPATPNLTSIAAHLQANEAFYQQDLAVGNPGLTADIPERVFVQFLAGYRNDAVTNGDITLRVSLWNLSTDAEIIGRDLVLKDPGVDSDSNANQLLAYQFGFVYDASAHSGDGLGIRIAHVSPSLADAFFTATAMIDDVEISIDGEFEPVEDVYQAWALANGLTPGVNDGRFDDADGSGTVNVVEFFLNGDPLDPADNGWIQAVSDGADGRGMILTFAAPEGTDFEGGAVATIHGVTCVVQGSLNLVDFSAPVSEIVPPVVPASWPEATEGWQYHSFELDGSAGFPERGFLRLAID